MKIKTEPKDDDHGAASREKDAKSPQKTPRSGSSKPQLEKATASFPVKAEKTDSRVHVQVKQEASGCSAGPSVVIKKEAVDRVADLTTHTLKSEVKPEPESETSNGTSKRSKKKKPVRRKAAKRKGAKKKTKRKTSKKGTRKGRKAKVVRSSRGVVSSVRARIAAKIGLTKRKALGPHSLPLINKPHSELPPVRSDVVPAMSLLGRGLSYGDAPQLEDVEELGSQTLLASRSLFTSARLSDLKAGIIPDPLEEIRLNTSDLLGSILETQEVLLSRSKEIIVSRDGTLKLNHCAGVRKHALTTNESNEKDCKSPPALNQHSAGNGAHENNQRVDENTNSRVSESSSISNSKEESVTLVRTTALPCGMPLKKRKFESRELLESAGAQQPADPVDTYQPAVTQDAGKVESQESAAKPDEESAAVNASLQPETSSPSLINQRLFAEKSIAIKLEFTSEKTVPKEAKLSGLNEIMETKGTDERKVKRCRHGKIVQDKNSRERETKGENNQGREENENKVTPETKFESRDAISKSNRPEETKKKVVVRSEVRSDEKVPVKSGGRSENAGDKSSHSYRSSHQRKNADDVPRIESSDRRHQHYSREKETDRSRSSRRDRKQQQQQLPSPRRNSRLEDDRLSRRSDIKTEHKVRRHSNDSEDKEQDRDRKRRHHHRINPHQHTKDDGKGAKDAGVSERNTRADPLLTSEAKVIHSKSKSYDKALDDSAAFASSKVRKMSGPKTPPDVLKSRSGSNDSAPTPTLDETDTTDVEPANGSGHPQGRSNRRPVPSRAALNNIKDYLQSDTPLFASPTRVSNTSWLKPASRPDTFARAPSSSNPSRGSVSSQVAVDKELDSGTNSSAIKQLLQSMFPNSKSVGSTVNSASPYSPAGSPADSPTLGELDGKKPSFQSVIDQILKSAQEAQQKPAIASQFKKPHELTKSESIQEGKKKVKASVRRHVSGDEASSAEDMHLSEKYLDKLNRQERVVEEVKMVLKPFYQRREVDKFQYKEIMRKAVPKVCHNKSQEINPAKIKALVERYIKQIKAERNKTSNGS